MNMNSSGTFGKLTPMGYEQLASPATTTKLTVPKGARVALINCDTQAVRWRDDGTAPTITVGVIMNVANEPLLYTGNLNKLQFIEMVAGANVNVSYYG